MNWEYRVLSEARVGSEAIMEPLSQSLTQLGLQGWELVSAVPVTNLSVTAYVLFVFKRAKH